MLTLIALTAALADDTPRWHVDVLAGADFPIDVGVRLHAESPLRLRFGLDVGLFPGAWLQALNAVAEAAGWYGEGESQAIEDTLRNALVLSPHLGFRPLRRQGFVFDVGYRLAALGGSTTPTTLLAALTGQAVPPIDDDVARDFRATAVLHMLMARVGWEWEPVRHLAVRLDVGGTFTVASQTTITPDEDVRAPALWEPLTTAGEVYLDDTFQRYVHTPTIGLSLGYRW